ncbi:aminodeoxychorismate lyase [Salibacterium halotolerans]|uniref:4-amino-4-deoxychorismate lyase n=1 Tax=Salibacterium halotolerans TaxID=1884432 RepID=A0A1I5WK25_9BACI|nr:aminodeoxychorismate lyase [Salibacterium halotolerans]SFQ20030.1 4-amino-4-deoxychorismate lyase [Salibacterium halotolerans]
MYVYINGEVEEAGAARLSVFEHGFMYGLGLFETFRTYNGHPFLLDDHFRRMENGLKEMNISWTYDRQTVLSQLERLLEANGWNNAYVRYNVSAGPAALGMQAEVYDNPVVVIYMKPLPAPEEMQEPSKTGEFLRTTRNTPETPERLKSHHYLNNVAGKRETGAAPGVEGLFLTERGAVAEGVVSNIFWRRGDTLYTPSVETGILRGVTRSFVMKLAEANGYYVRQGRFSPGHVYRAEEAFLTNSIQEIVPLEAVGTCRYNEKQQTAARLLRKDYAAYRGCLWNAAEMKEPERKKERGCNEQQGSSF